MVEKYYFKNKKQRWQTISNFLVMNTIIGSLKKETVVVVGRCLSTNEVKIFRVNEIGVLSDV